MRHSGARRHVPDEWSCLRSQRFISSVARQQHTRIRTELRNVKRLETRVGAIIRLRQRGGALFRAFPGEDVSLVDHLAWKSKRCREALSQWAVFILKERIKIEGEGAEPQLAASVLFFAKSNRGCCDAS